MSILDFLSWRVFPTMQKKKKKKKNLNLLQLHKHVGLNVQEK